MDQAVFGWIAGTDRGGRLGFVIWASIVPDPLPEALAALRSDGLVAVRPNPGSAFSQPPVRLRRDSFFIPGAKVDPRSYAPAARALAAEGYLVVVPSMRLNLAVLSANRADEIIAAHPTIRHWVIGGHSLGGAMAAQYASAHPRQGHGAGSVGAYPTSDMSQQSIKVASIYATNDGLLPVSRIAQSRAQLPASAVFRANRGRQSRPIRLVRTPGWRQPRRSAGRSSRIRCFRRR
jgi:pimeloyl-ACP methyl ester carboxylesterase